MNGHIAKPIDIEKLGEVILSVLNKQENLQTGKNNSMNANRLRLWASSESGLRMSALMDNKEEMNEQKDRKTDKKKR